MIASWLIVLAPTGSALHIGAPTSAASGITMSAFLSKGAIVSSIRMSPLTTLNFGSWQTWFRLVWRNMKLSSTVTRWPALSSSGTRIEPR